MSRRYNLGFGHSGVAIQAHGEKEGITHMYATFDLNNAPLNFDCTLDPQDDFDGFLNDDVGVTELATSPAPQANRSQDKLQKSNHASTEPDLAHDGATQARKQRALEKSREAQKRFRHRQKVLVSTIRACNWLASITLQPSLTTGEA